MAIRAVALALLLAGGCAPLPRSPAAELQAALEAAQRTRIEGPAEVRLAARMTLQLQPRLAFIPAAEATRLLRALGRAPRERLLGLVVADVAAGGVEAAALYARGEHLPGIPELEIAGWEPAPGLVVLLPR